MAVTYSIVVWRMGYKLFATQPQRILEAKEAYTLLTAKFSQVDCYKIKSYQHAEVPGVVEIDLTKVEI